LLAALVLLAAEAPRQISETTAGAYEASLASTSAGFAIAWYDTRDGHPEIYMRNLDARGQPASSERRLTNGSAAAYEADIAAGGDRRFIAWYEHGPADASRAMLGAWADTGLPLWSKTMSAAGRNGRNPVVRVRDRTIFYAWLEYDAGGDPDVWAAWLDLDGRPAAPARRIAPAGRTTWNLNAALGDPDRAWIAFDANAGTASDELFLARVEKSSSQVYRVTADDGKPSKYPDIGLNGSRAAVTWFDERDGNQEVYLAIASIDALTRGVEPRAIRVTHTPGESIGAYLAWNGDRLGLAWSDNTPGQSEIYVETFDAGLHALEPVRRITDNPTQSLIPSIRAAGDGFALAWNEFVPGPAGGHDPRGTSQIAFALVR